MGSKTNSFEEKIKLPVTETISRFYQPQRNRKAIRIITVAVYVLCVSLAAIMLSLYYIFIWDPTIKPFVPKVVSCDKIIIPENIAIRFINSTEISAEKFYKSIIRHYQIEQNKVHIKSKNNVNIQKPKTIEIKKHITELTTKRIPISNTFKLLKMKFNEDDEDDNDESFDGSGYEINDS